MYNKFKDELKSVCEQKRIKLSTIGNSEGYDIFYFELNPEIEIRICTIAGIHGDEIGWI